MQASFCSHGTTCVFLCNRMCICSPCVSVCWYGLGWLNTRYVRWTLYISGFLEFQLGTPPSTVYFLQKYITWRKSKLFSLIPEHITQKTQCCIQMYPVWESLNSSSFSRGCEGTAKHLGHIIYQSQHVSRLNREARPHRRLFNSTTREIKQKKAK